MGTEVFGAFSSSIQLLPQRFVFPFFLSISCFISAAPSSPHCSSFSSSFFHYPLRSFSPVSSFLQSVQLLFQTNSFLLIKHRGCFLKIVEYLRNNRSISICIPEGFRAEGWRDLYQQQTWISTSLSIFRPTWIQSFRIEEQTPLKSIITKGLLPHEPPHPQH